MKHKLLMPHLKEEHPFGKTVADVSVIALQKRGLAHAHIILFLQDESKKAQGNLQNVDRIISAEIPSDCDSHL